MTGLFLLLGHPVRHSRSPALHNAAFAALGLDARYLAADVSPGSLAAAIRGLRALGVAGANVTTPHKEAVVHLLDDLDEAAATAGAVNTIVRRRDGLVGCNTDGLGVIDAAAERRGFQPRGTTVALVGAGGAARGIAVALARQGCGRLLLLNRTAARAHDLAARLGDRTPIDILPLDGASLRQAREGADLIVNTTPLPWPRLAATLAGREAAADADADAAWEADDGATAVCDLVYRDGAADRAGAGVAVGPLDVLLHQAAHAFRLWTRLEPPLEAMRAALEGEGRAPAGDTNVTPPRAMIDDRDDAGNQNN